MTKRVLIVTPDNYSMSPRMQALIDACKKAGDTVIIKRMDKSITGFTADTVWLDEAAEISSLSGLRAKSTPRR